MNNITESKNPLINIVWFWLYVLILSCTGLPYSNGQTDVDIIENNLMPPIILKEQNFGSQTWNILDRMEHYNIPGVSITIILDGDIQHTLTHGHTTSSNQENAQSLDKETLFQAASISKPVATIGLMQLVEKHNIDIDLPVNTFLKTWKIPENRFTEKTPVTVRHLLTHTGGTTVGGFNGYHTSSPIPNTAQILDGTPPSNSDPVVVDTIPGSIWRYSGGGYTIIEKLVEDLSGQTFEEYMNENVFNPLGNVRSTFTQPLPEHLHSNIAFGHKGDGNVVDGKWHNFPEKAAAGLWTTPHDLAQINLSFLRALRGSKDEIISPKSAMMMMTSHKNNWGLGFSLIGTKDSLWFSHGGSNYGYRCNMFTSPNKNAGVVIMTNGNRGAGLYSEILRSISKVYNWDIYQPQIKNVINLTAEDTHLLSGKYTHLPDPKYTINVEEIDSILYVTQTWNDVHFPIYPETQLEFFEKIDGVTFVFNKHTDGSINEIVINGDWILTKEK